MGRNGLVGAGVVGAGGGPLFRNVTNTGGRVLGFRDGNVSVSAAQATPNGGQQRRIETERASDAAVVNGQGPNGVGVDAAVIERNINGRLPVGTTSQVSGAQQGRAALVTLTTAPGSRPPSADQAYRAVRNGLNASR